MAKRAGVSQIEVIKTAIIGASGYIGRHLWAAYNEVFPGTLGTAFSSQNPHFSFFDIRQPDITPLHLEEQSYEAVIITAAKPNIGFCEDHPDDAHAVNVKGMLELVRQLGQTSLQTIFLSTDYVFEGTAGNYEDDAPTKPTTEYGRQKVLVEQAIPSLTNNFLILRIGKIYGIEKGDKTLIDDLANCLAGRQTVQCASDQLFCPTLISDLTTAIMHLQVERCRGIFNLCSAETWSRYEIAMLLAKEMRADSNLVRKIALYDLPSMKGRPLNTTMKCNSLLVQELQCAFTPLTHNIKKVAASYQPSVTQSK